MALIYFKKKRDVGYFLSWYVRFFRIFKKLGICLEYEWSGIKLLVFQRFCSNLAYVKYDCIVKFQGQSDPRECRKLFHGDNSFRCLNIITSNHEIRLLMELSMKNPKASKYLNSEIITSFLTKKIVKFRHPVKRDLIE